MTFVAFRETMKIFFCQIPRRNALLTLLPFKCSWSGVKTFPSGRVNFNLKFDCQNLQNASDGSSSTFCGPGVLCRSWRNRRVKCEILSKTIDHRHTEQRRPREKITLWFRKGAKISLIFDPRPLLFLARRTARKQSKECWIENFPVYCSPIVYTCTGH